MRAAAALSTLVFCAACGAAAPEDGAQVDLAPAAFPLDAYPARCGAALLEGFETAPALAPWHSASWASATLDGNGNPMRVSSSAAGATQGRLALSVGVRFTGAGYEQGYVGREGLALSLAGCATVAVDVTLPASAPQGLGASLVLLLGPAAAWNGAADRTALAPGATTTVRLPLSGGIEPVPPRELFKRLQGVGLKIEGTGVAWSGQVALDNVRVEGLQGPAPEDRNAFPVGTFGGFVRQGTSEIPARNGFLDFSADSTVQGHGLRWAMLGPDRSDFVVGMAFFGDARAPTSPPRLGFLDWTTLRAEQELPGGGAASVLLSRAFPAARYTSDASAFLWQTGLAGRAPMSRLAFVENGRLVTHAPGSEAAVDLSGMSEPWVLLWAGTAAGWSFDAPTLLTFQRRPRAARDNGAGLTFDFGQPLGSVQAMPLYGLRRWDTTGWDQAIPGDAVVQARALVPILAAYPIGNVESSAVNQATGLVTVTNHYQFAEVADDWGTQPEHVAAFPPAVVHAGGNGYPVHYPNGSPRETEVATWFGWYAYAPGDAATYTLPIPAALTRQPIALRVVSSPATAPIRAELERVLNDEVPNAPGTYWLGNDESDADFMCDGWSTFLPGSAARLKAQALGPQLAENTFLSRSLGSFLEPVTGQQYLAPTSYPASIEPFDKEWNNGRLLASLARCAEAVDLDLARGAWPKLLAAYRYDRIFFDWATGSVLSSAYGINELADGIHFAWDGMLGVGRLARKLGDEATWNDVAYRSARQQLALYETWFQAQWSKDLDYGVGHISDARLPQAEIETRGAIDGYVEDYGCATLELKSFWQTTNYLYFDVPAQLSLYRDYGLEARVNALEYRIMPALHPGWADGNATDPVDQRYYGSNYTSAHLVARALLFHDDPAALLRLYNGPRGSLASQQWYSMYFHGMAGPTLLSLERGGATPLLEAPVGQIRVAAASYDAKSGKLGVDFQALQTGTVVFRTRKPGGVFKNHPVAVKAGTRYPISFAP